MRDQDYIPSLLEKAKANENFRQVLTTGTYTQVVLMSLQPGQDIGMETHPHNDQMLLCVDGDGEAEVGGQRRTFAAGDAVLVRAGLAHNFTNTGATPMKIVTTYGPPNHADGTIHRIKADAEANEG